MKLMNLIRENEMFDDWVKLIPSDYKKLASNYKNLNPNNTIEVDTKTMKQLGETDPIYVGYNKKTKTIHWKWISGQYKLYLDYKDKRIGLSLVNNPKSVKNNHPWG